MGIVWLVVIIVGIIVGAYFFLRSPPPAPLGPTPPDENELRTLRELVLKKLQDRLVGWTFEAPDREVSLLVAKDSATEREARLELAQLAARWKVLHDGGEKEKADDLLEAFVEGVSGQAESEQSESIDRQAFASALALALMPPAEVPPNALTRKAGALASVLVLRNPEGPEPLTAEDLKTHEMGETEAFEQALAHLEAEAAEGLPVETIAGTQSEPDALRIAPEDPLAAAFALTPSLAKRLSEAHAGRALRLWPARPDVLIALLGETQPDALDVEIDNPMSPPLAPDALATAPRG